MIRSYARVSTEQQASEGSTSIAEQQRKIAAVAQLRGVSAYEITTYVDAGVSGSIQLNERPAGAKMLLDAGPGDVIIAAKLDRLFRSASDALVTVEKLQELGVDVILVDIGIDPVTANGPAKLFFSMLSAFAEFERTRIAERMADGRNGKVARRGHLGGAAPYGYRVVGEGRGAQIEANPEEVVVVQKIFQMVREGRTLSQLRNRLNEAGHRTRTGKEWTIGQLMRIIERNTRLRKLGRGLFYG